LLGIRDRLLIFEIIGNAFLYVNIIKGRQKVAELIRNMWYKSFKPIIEIHAWSCLDCDQQHDLKFGYLSNKTGMALANTKIELRFAK